MRQQFATFKEACDYKVDDKQHECGDGKFFISEERFIDAASNWGTASTTRTPSSSSAAPATEAATARVDKADLTGGPRNT